MSGKLTIGLPSKGRLQENANAFFARAGLRVKQDGGRGYTGRLAGIENVEIAFLSASEIAGQLEQGLIQLGVTGEDLIREKLSTPERDVELLLPLGFGHADVVVAVPQSWIDVATMADLDDVAGHSKLGANKVGAMLDCVDLLLHDSVHVIAVADTIWCLILLASLGDTLLG